VDYYSVLKNFAGPFATLCAAIAATYFARQQWKTAQRQAETAAQLAETAKRQGERQATTADQQAKTALDQLRFNLFEKRYATYRAVEQFLKTLIEDADSRPLEVAPYYRVFDEAKFFFSPATCKWLETVRADCQAFLDLNAMRQQAGLDPRAQDQFLEMHHKLAGHFMVMPERFCDDMSFRQLTDPAR